MSTSVVKGPRLTRADWLIACVLVAASLFVYWQTPGFDFTNFDDNIYVAGNPHVSTGLTMDNVVWAFTSHRGNNWHPLTWMSHMLDAQFCELDPSGHHETNVALHIANVLLLFFVLKRLTGSRWRSACVAALFAVHPLHVESVAWVAERKDVLSTLFWLLTMLAYIGYVRRPGWARYLLVVVAYVLGLMSKPMLVSLPLILLLMDYWPLGRVSDRRSFTLLVREKIPLFALALASCVATFTIQKVTGAVGSLDAYPLGVRIANAVVAGVGYLLKTVWPVGLACFYPHPGSGIPGYVVIGSDLLLALVTVLAVRALRTRPYLLVGWLWYLITLVPVIGIVQVGKQAMADRYSYVPLIGVFVTVVWGVGELVCGRFGKRKAVLGAVAALAVMLLALLAGVAHRQTAYWRNDVSVWERAIAVTQGNAIAHFNLGTTLAVQGDEDAAMRHFAEAVRIEPRKYDAHCNLGVMLLQRGRIDEGIRHLRAAIEVRPGDYTSQINLGLALALQGKHREAIPHLRVALRARPGDADAQAALAESMERSRQ